MMLERCDFFFKMVCFSGTCSFLGGFSCMLRRGLFELEGDCPAVRLCGQRTGSLLCGGPGGAHQPLGGHRGCNGGKLMGFTSWKFNSSPPKIWQFQKDKNRLPSTIFQGLLLFLMELRRVFGYLKSPHNGEWSYPYISISTSLGEWVGVVFKGGIVRKKSRVSTANLLPGWLGGGFKLFFSPRTLGKMNPI